MNSNDKNDFSFEYIYEEYKNLVYNLCYKYLNSKEEAEDACHDIFIKIYKNLATFKGDSKLSTWIYKLTVNYCLNCLRRKKIIKFITFENFLGEEKLSNFLFTEGIDIKYESDETLHYLQKAIDLLNEKQKTALLLNKYEGLSYKEISEIMDCSISSVESLIYRAKQNLVKQLLKYKKK